MVKTRAQHRDGGSRVVCAAEDVQNGRLVLVDEFLEEVSFVEFHDKVVGERVKVGSSTFHCVVGT